MEFRQELVHILANRFDWEPARLLNEPWLEDGTRPCSASTILGNWGAVEAEFPNLFTAQTVPE